MPVLHFLIYCIKDNTLGACDLLFIKLLSVQTICKVDAIHRSNVQRKKEKTVKIIWGIFLVCYARFKYDNKGYTLERLNEYNC